ncbi:MAG: hypothetical protein ACI91R_000445, partial [Vicingaceae bacterium]
MNFVYNTFLVLHYPIDNKKPVCCAESAKQLTIKSMVINVFIEKVNLYAHLSTKVY